ncbi:MAG: thylakoid-associated protein [Gomphosphaeria aponina SAG 52.96 = DSM 107014]|uniref:Thylakoid-associated protein n=1 Tax=Gomphosphaeria aponina SAG 52.96 = DSM 107014 TaxID=1521640 RepID=A0A941GQA7_9CHRO|nr:thylakoid-associated protein [Gomphosphaeria aponina SAG 52.96 = DSM 107014]
MDANFFEEYQKQLNQWQQKFFDSWFENIPSIDNQFNLSDSLDKTLSFQQSVVQTALKNQKIAIDLTMEAQEKLWDNYFELLRKTASMKTEEEKAA